MTPLNPETPPRPSAARRRAVRLSAVVAAVGVVAGLASCRDPRPGNGTVPGAQVGSAPALPPHLFRKWPKPDLVLVLSGSMHGYLQPCGCSKPQVGGLERRYNFVQILRQKGWPVVAVDLGDLPQKEGPVRLPNVQGLLKYAYTMRALKQTGYSAVGIGEYEMSLDLFKVLGEWALNEPSPRVVVANLANADVDFPGETKKWEPAQAAGSDLKVGVTGLVGRTVAKRAMAKDSKPKFARTGNPLGTVLREMGGEGIDLRVLLYQGSQTLPFEPDPGEEVKKVSAEAVECAKRYPQFDVVVALSEEDEPSAEPVWVPNAAAERKTLVAALGHKGKNIGVVGVYRTGNPARPLELRYQLVRVTEEFETPEAQEKDHPIARLMEDYTRELRDQNYLGKYYQVNHPLQVSVKGVTPTYVGTDKCKKCHESAYEVWKGTPHSRAYQTLVDAKHPSNRQYDGECIVCHTVGFGYRSGFTDARRTPHLENVGCESCHGPGSEHVANPNNKQWQALMNAWKAPEDETAVAKVKRLGNIDDFCQRCHDSDNDVTWINNAFPKKWKKIAHPTVPE